MLYGTITALVTPMDRNNDIDFESLNQLNYLNKNKPTEFILLSGDDHSTLAFLLCGGNGVISVVSNIFPDQFNQMVIAAISKDVDNAIKLNNKLFDFYDFLFSQTNPILTKWCMHLLGLIKYPNLRLPLTLPKEPHTTSALNYINQIRNI